MSAPKLWREEAPTKAAALRKLLFNRAPLWVSHAEMMAAGGSRFGARLQAIRNGWDGGQPWRVIVQHTDTTRPEYLLAGINHDPKPKPKQRKAKTSACPHCGESLQVAT